MSLFCEQRLRIVVFNVENLFVFLDHYTGQNLDSLSEKEWQKLSASTTPNKPLEQVRQLAKAIQDMDPDILMLCEVGGRESLVNFSRLFLQDLYAPYLIEGNSDRGIDLGYLVKRSLPFKYDLFSHKNRPIDFLYPHERQSKETNYDELESARLVSHRFSRDVLELRIFASDGLAGAKPELILLLVHLKSRLDPNRIDPGGRDRRKAELEKLVKIYHEISEEFGGETPILIGGDFNGSAGLPEPEEEFKALYEKTQLKDVLEVAVVPPDERFTYLQLYNGNRVGSRRQIDYLFVPPELFQFVDSNESWVFRFKDEMGMNCVIPRNLYEKKLLPSDHYPVILTLRPFFTS